MAVDVSFEYRNTWLVIRFCLPLFFKLPLTVWDHRGCGTVRTHYYYILVHGQHSISVFSQGVQ